MSVADGYLLQAAPSSSQSRLISVGNIEDDKLAVLHAEHLPALVLLAHKRVHSLLEIGRRSSPIAPITASSWLRNLLH